MSHGIDIVTVYDVNSAIMTVGSLLVRKDNAKYILLLQIAGRKPKSLFVVADLLRMFICCACSVLAAGSGRSLSGQRDRNGWLT
jgi:hypothetical protein